ncbi:proline racemase family protein [Spiribacter vilamensis]|uniref:Proline racemase n=1 Tax=Spiribacter vilamensis TaxID=531306 RepID=A0A4Q8D242_9GAMM|nr:proline racemase family protein [Spiribacter vilamensis]RZU99360.1 proline racemase [Spiribacter vilamensis]
MTAETRRYRYTDLHAAGEPVRIITGGAPTLAGETLLDKRRDAMERHDAVRRHLMLEPRGHADMYGVWPTEPDHPDCALAVLFMHNEGYSTMCGHATIALGRWVLETGRVTPTPPVTHFHLQCPCGPVAVRVTTPADGPIGAVSFDSVPVFAGATGQALSLPDHGRIDVDIAYGGAYYAVLPASRLGLDLYTSAYETLIAAARAIIVAGREQLVIDHPDTPDLGFLYGCLLTDGQAPSANGETRNLCVFGGGQVDRSATGSGIAGRLALAHQDNGIAAGETCAVSGLSGIAFDGAIREVREDGRLIVTVTGTGYRSGAGEFEVERDDPLRDGFELPARLAEQAG